MEKRAEGIEETKKVFVLIDGRTFTVGCGSKVELPIVNVFLFIRIFSIRKSKYCIYVLCPKVSKFLWN